MRSTKAAEALHLPYLPFSSASESQTPTEYANVEFATSRDRGHRWLGSRSTTRSQKIHNRLLRCIDGVSWTSQLRIPRNPLDHSSRTMDYVRRPTYHPSSGLGRHGSPVFRLPRAVGNSRTRPVLHGPPANSQTTVTAARDRQEFSKSTAYKYANTLDELGVAAELDNYED